MAYCGIGMLEMGAEDSGVEPWGRLVEGGLEGCERGSIMEESRETHGVCW